MIFVSRISISHLDKPLSGRLPAFRPGQHLMWMKPDFLDPPVAQRHILGGGGIERFIPKTIWLIPSGSKCSVVEAKTKSNNDEGDNFND